MNFTTIKSLNFSKNTRNKSKIKFIIIHYTGMQSKRASISRLTNIKSKVSCHYLICRKGEIVRMVDDQKIAWHAGKSKWKNYKNLNANSIGIELVNKGHKIKYEKFTKLQIHSTRKLCKFLKKKYKIKDESILGHSDIAPFRKLDPGEKFPWKKIIKIKLNSLNIKKNFLYLKKKEVRILFFRNLFKIGYRYFNRKEMKARKDQLIIKAFQRRYMQQKIDGLIDQKTYEISHFLTKSS